MRQYYFSKQKIKTRRKSIAMRFMMLLCLVSGITWILCSNVMLKEFLHKESIQKNQTIGMGEIAIVFESSTLKTEDYTDVEVDVVHNLKTVNSQVSSRVSRVFAKAGKTLSKGSPVLQFVTGEKITMPENGVISKMYVSHGSVIDIGSKLFIVMNKESVMTLRIPRQYYDLISEKLSIIIVRHSHNIKTVVLKKSEIIDGYFTIEIAQQKHFSMSDKLSISTKSRDSNIRFIPFSAILHHGNQYFVKVLQSGVVASVNIEILKIENGTVLVSGLDKNKIIMFGGQYFIDGTHPKVMLFNEAIQNI